jgi:hypothetical protein
VVIAAEQYASRMVLPSSQQHSPMRWSSHKDQARKALTKLAVPHLSATLEQVEKAIAKAHAEHETATRRPDTTSRTPAGVVGEAEAEPGETGALEGDRVDVDERRNEQGVDHRVPLVPGPGVVPSVLFEMAQERDDPLEREITDRQLGEL